MDQRNMSDLGCLIGSDEHWANEVIVKNAADTISTNMRPDRTGSKIFQKTRESSSTQASLHWWLKRIYLAYAVGHQLFRPSTVE